MTSTVAPDPDTPPAKRQKIREACSLCRTRKSKCDGARPVCGPCLKRRNGRQQCAYQDGDHAPPKPSAPVESSEQPLSRTIIEQPPTARRAVSPASSRESDSTDAMGAVDSWALKAGLLGASSSTNFMRQMRRAVDGRDSPALGDRGAASSHVTHEARRLLVRQHEWKKNLHGVEYVLPPRSTADRLMDIYWRYAWTIFPFVDDAQILKCYYGLWSGSSTQAFDQQIFHCILNLAFALACKLDPEAAPGEQESSSHTYFVRARTLLVFELFNLSDFNLVQALLLMSQYLQSTKMPRECFQTVGLAIWIARDLGLHLPETVLAIHDDRQRGIVQRVWKGCILMDRITAMTYGRPMRLEDEKASALTPTLQDASDTHSSRLRFFEEYYQLHLILGDILSSFYTSKESKKSRIGPAAEVLDQLMRFEKKLTEWYNGLTPYLKTPLLPGPARSEEDSDQSIFQRQANVLYARWLHAHILLWRPFLSQPLDIEIEESSFPSQISRFTNEHCQAKCATTARDLVTFIHQILENQSGGGISYWYSIYYLYNAGTILIASSMFPALSQTIPQAALGVSIEQAFRCLRRYETYTVSARRCRIALEVLQKKITATGNMAWSESAPKPGLFLYSGTAESNIDRVTAPTGMEDAWTLFEGMDMFWLDNALMDPNDVAAWS